MKKIEWSKANIKKFFEKRGFYLVSCLCLLAVGVASYVAYDNMPKPPVDVGQLSSTPESVSSNESVEAPEVNKNVSDAKDDRKESQASNPTEIVQTQPKADFFVLPLTGTIIKKYSDKEVQYSETFKDLRIHKAVDIAGDISARVTSAGDGKVIEIGKDAMLGTFVVIDHGGDIKAKYCGLNSVPAVHVGDIVDSTTHIGDIAVIPSESANQPHLHLEMTKGGKSVSPFEIMGMSE